MIGKKYNIIEVLPKVLIEYNNTIHSTIKMTPTEASMTKNQDKVRQIYNEKYSDYDPKEPKIKLNIGDKVRISKIKRTFEKGYTPNWSKEIFIIDKVQDTKPTTYKLKDLKVKKY